MEPRRKISSRSSALTFWAICFFLLSLTATAKLKTPKLQPKEISFLAFGDSGYHYDYVYDKVLKNPLDEKGFHQYMLEKWLKNKLPQSEFVAPPTYKLPSTGQTIEASGALPVAQAMFNFCKKETCHFGIMLGDNIYPSGATGKDDEIRFQKILIDPYKKLQELNRHFYLYAALGNHDWYTSRVGRDRMIQFGERKNNLFKMQSPGYYKFSKGPVDFFVIDTNLLLAGTTVYESKLKDDGSEKKTTKIDRPKKWIVPVKEEQKQIQWLENELKSSKAPWKIVYGHHTLWSSGGVKHGEARALRKLIRPLICRYADVYFAGHEHELEVNTDDCRGVKGAPKAPLLLVVSGAGAWQRPIHKAFQKHQAKTNPEFTPLWSQGMTWGFSHVKISGSKLNLKMLTTPNEGTGTYKENFSFSHSKRTL